VKGQAGLNRRVAVLCAPPAPGPSDAELARWPAPPPGLRPQSVSNPRAAEPRRPGSVGRVLLLVGQRRFERWASWGGCGAAMAARATEQSSDLWGSGPVAARPGGPSFKDQLCKAARAALLGGLCGSAHTPQGPAKELARLLVGPRARDALGGIGRRRWGGAAGSERLAALAARGACWIRTCRVRGPGPTD